jgi:hypothetical protein
MKELADWVEWKEKPQYNTIPKKRLRQLIRICGNSANFARKIKRSKAYVSKLISKECKKGQRLITNRPARRIEKIFKIKGIADELSRVY